MNAFYFMQPEQNMKINFKLDGRSPPGSYFMGKATDSPNWHPFLLLLRWRFASWALAPCAHSRGAWTQTSHRSIFPSSPAHDSGVPVLQAAWTHCQVLQGNRFPLGTIPLLPPDPKAWGSSGVDMPSPSLMSNLLISHLTRLSSFLEAGSGEATFPNRSPLWMSLH